MDEILFKYQKLPVNLPTPNLAMFKAADGKSITLKLYPITTLAKNLNRTSYTIRRWEKLGWIPKSWRIKNKGRYYTKSQIQLLLYLSMRHNLQVKDNVGKAMSQKFIDQAFEHMSELISLTLDRKCTQDLHVEETKHVKKEAK